MIFLKFLLAIVKNPIELLDKKSNFFDEVHFGRDFPSNVFCKFEKDFLRVDTACTVVFFFLRVVEKFGLVA